MIHSQSCSSSSKIRIKWEICPTRSGLVIRRGREEKGSVGDEKKEPSIIVYVWKYH